MANGSSGIERGDHSTTFSGLVGQTLFLPSVTAAGVPIAQHRTEFRVVKNASGGTLTGSDVLKWSTAGSEVTKATAGALVCGVVDSVVGTDTIAANEYFLMAVRGLHTVLSDASFSALDPLKAANTGQARTATLTDGETFAIAREAATDADQKKLAFLECE